MSSNGKTADLVLFFPCCNFVKMLCKETERLKVVLGQLMKQFLELEHSTFTVLGPVSGNYTLVQICKHTHIHTNDDRSSKHAIGNASNI